MVEGEAIYKPGDGCKSADGCTAHPGSHCDTSSGLCIAPERTISARMRYKSTAVTSVTVSTTTVEQPTETATRDDETSLEENSTGEECCPTQNSSKLETSAASLAHNLQNNGTVDLDVVPRVQGKIAFE